MSYESEELPQKNKKTEAQDLVIAAKFSPSGGYVGGITVREYFAAMAMQGILSERGIKEFPEYWDELQGVPCTALRMADALIAELNK